MKNKPHKYFGLKFYSKFFNSWCVVTHFRNDDDWYFVTESRPMIVLKAQSNFREYVLEEELKE